MMNNTLLRLATAMAFLLLLAACGDPSAGADVQDTENPADSSAAVDINWHLVNADEFYASGEYAEAALQYGNALAMGGTDEEMERAYLGYYQCHMKLDNQSEALRILEMAISQVSESSEIHSLYAAMRAEQGGDEDKIKEELTGYPTDNDPRWILGGELLALRKGETVRFVDMNNELVKEVQLTIPIQQYAMIAAGRELIVAYNSPVVYSVDGEWTAGNLSVFDMDGNELIAYPWKNDFDFSGMEYDYASNNYPQHVAVWNGKTVFLLENRKLFALDVDTGKITVVEDMEELVQENSKSGYGVRDCYDVDDSGLYYVVEYGYKTDVCWTDGTDKKVLFSDRAYNVVIKGGYVAMLCYASPDMELKWAALGDDELKSLSDYNISRSEYAIQESRLTFAEGDTIYCLDMKTQEIISFEAPGWSWLYGSVETNGEIQVIYSITESSKGTYYIRTQDSVKELPDDFGVNADELWHPKLTHYMKYAKGLESVKPIVPMEDFK